MECSVSQENDSSTDLQESRILLMLQNTRLCLLDETQDVFLQRLMNFGGAFVIPKTNRVDGPDKEEIRQRVIKG